VIDGKLTDAGWNAAEVISDFHQQRGVKGDHLNGDASFDPVWEGAAAVDSLGWTAEFRIPLSPS
jgi:hypothetical protein